MEPVYTTEEIENANRVLAVFETIPKKDFEVVLFLVNHYFEGMDISPHPPPCGDRESRK